MIGDLLNSNQYLLDQIFRKPRPADYAHRLHWLPCPVLRVMALRSPTPLSSIPQEPEFYVPNGPHENLVGLGLDHNSMTTLSRFELLSPLRTFNLVVPAPMTARNGWQPVEQEASNPVNSNTGHVYAAVFSAPELDLAKQFEAITALKQYGDLAFIVATGRGHLEAWFPTSTLNIPLGGFYEIAMHLGASPNIKNPSHPYHLPGGLDTATGKVHSVISLKTRVLEEMRADAKLTPAARKHSLQSKEAMRRKRIQERRYRSLSLTKSQKS